MEEIWKNIPGFPGYQASTLGRIRTHNKITYTEKHGPRHWKDRIMKFKISHNPKQKQGFGYKITLWKDGKPVEALVHRLVATTFLDNLINTKMTVNHKDGNRYNNNIDNLEWLTLEDNIRYGFKHKEYDACKKRVKLAFDSGEEYIFLSYRDASRFLNKYNGYVSGQIRAKQFDVKTNKGVCKIVPF